MSEFGALGIASIVEGFTKGLNEGMAARKKEDLQERQIALKEAAFEAAQTKKDAITSADAAQMLKFGEFVPVETEGALPVRIKGPQGIQDMGFRRVEDTAKKQRERLTSLQIESELDKKSQREKPVEETRKFQEKKASAKLAKELKEDPQFKRKSAIFAARIDQAQNVFSELVEKGLKREALVTSFKAFATPDALKSEGLKRQEQAEINFVNAVLRRESGAVISPTEFESAEKQYFPRAGDTKKLLAQKKVNRETVLAGLKTEAGKSYIELIEMLKKGGISLGGKNEDVLKSFSGEVPAGGKIERPQSGTSGKSHSEEAVNVLMQLGAFK